MLQHSTGLPTAAEAGADAGLLGTELLHSLLGGAGGAAMLAASLGPWGLGVLRRERAAPAPRRRAVGAAAEPVRVRTERLAPAGPDRPLMQPTAPWMASWLEAAPQRSNDWRIRL
jgi:hypothetical protein